ncbi:MAG TPA: hypothetical protein VJ890_04725 [Vineibacter sp.]|nr:hypothetical protein [Vineibacter sp.]
MTGSATCGGLPQRAERGSGGAHDGTAKITDWSRAADAPAVNAGAAGRRRTTTPPRRVAIGDGVNNEQGRAS